MRERHYFDHAASSPHTDACRAALSSYDAQPWAGANPNSLHSSGRAAFEVLEGARRRLARFLGARRPSELVFTSGGTESNNLALSGIARAVHEQSRGARTRILVSSLEHESVTLAARRLEREGLMRVEEIPSTPEGLVDLDELGRMLSTDVALVSVTAACNVLGTVQPLHEVVRRAHEAGALVHTDAVQAFGHIPFDVGALGVDAASVTAHKLGGPVGIGALYLKARTPIVPLLFGGGQEGGLRSGTVDVRGALAFAAVAQDAVDCMPSRAAYLRDLAGLLLDGLCEGAVPLCRPTVPGDRDGRFLPGILHLLVPGHQSEGLILGLDELGYEVAGGSACSSSSLEPDRVLTAIGIPRDLAFCALRLSFDHRTGVEECRGLVDALHRVCAPSAGRP